VLGQSGVYSRISARRSTVITSLLVDLLTIPDLNGALDIPQKRRLAIVSKAKASPLHGSFESADGPITTLLGKLVASGLHII